MQTISPQLDISSFLADLLFSASPAGGGNPSLILPMAYFVRSNNTRTRSQTMSESWLTYSEAAAAIGTSPEAVRQKSIREHWRRQRRKDGKTQVLIDLKAQKPSVPRKHPAKQVNVRPDKQGKVAAF